MVEKFEINGERENWLWVRLKGEKKFSVSMEIVFVGSEWSWYYNATNDYGEDYFFEIWSSKFEPGEEGFEKEDMEKVNHLFYELIRQLKTHPNYRLKVLNMLDDEIREIWNKV